MIRQPATLPASPAIAAAIAAGLEFHMLQQADEMIAFLTWLEQAAIPLRTVLEIGSHQGGSTAVFCSLAERVISIDLPDGVGGGLPITQAYQRNSALKARWPNFIGILGDSHEQTTLSEARDAIDNQPIDLLFIDGDHSGLGIAADFAMYSPLVRPGGVIAFHDIVGSADPRCVDVAPFWALFPTPKFIFSSDASWGGIGAIFKR